MNISQAVSKRICDLCNQKNITVNKLSLMAGVTQSTVDSILKGKSKNPGVRTIKYLCDALNISIIEFFADEIFENLDPDLD